MGWSDCFDEFLYPGEAIRIDCGVLIPNNLPISFRIA